MNPTKNTKTFSFLSLALAACNSHSVVKDAQCSAEEQSMFSECLSSGCSPSYSQDLSGADSCEYDASGSVVKVESGAECGFTSSGSCYVVCSCPEGSEVSFNVDTNPEVDYEGDDTGECLDGADNDRDGLYDCDDPDCHGSPDCKQESEDTGVFEEDTGAFEEDTGAFEEDTGDDESPDEGADLDGDGYSVEDGDCNDGNPAVNPSASDVVGDSIDQNCDGIDGTDMDADGFASIASGGDDCDDFDSVINPDFGVVDIEDYVDSNCDGVDSLSYTYKAVRLDSLSPVNSGGHGDFDGDGLQDIIVYNRSDYYIFYGSTIQSSSGILTASDADVEIHFGSSAYEVADIDGDGKDDLAFSTSNAEYSHIFYGSTISSTSNLIPGSNEDVLISESYGYSGCPHTPTSISFIDDLTGDGLPDAIITGCTTGVIAQSNELGSGGDAYTWSVGTRVSGAYLSVIRTQMAGLDLDSDGYPDYMYYYTHSSYSEKCAKDISSGSCIQDFRTFIPTMVLPDIDGDGDKELSDGYCIQNSSNLTDTSYCDYNIRWGHQPESFIDFDGDGLYDLADSSSITLDITGGGTGTVTVNYHSVYNSNIADFNGDGMDDLVVSSGGDTYIVGIL